MLDIAVVGAGKWAHECWVPLLLESADRYAVRAVIDPAEDRARSLAVAFGLPTSAAHVDLDTALRHSPGIGIGIVLSSPERHADCIVDLAGRGLDVLTEKPLAANPQDAKRIARAVREAGVKLAVIQNSRYQNRIQIARRIIRSGELSELNYLVVRFAADYRRLGSWDVGDAHAMDHPLLIEGSIHHLDMIRYLTGLDVQSVTALTRNPDWSSFQGDCVGGLLLRLDEGPFALYEANLLAGGTESRWRQEHYRVECRYGSVTCDGPQVILNRSEDRKVIEAPDPDMWVGHRRIVRDFAAWLHGGPPVETTLDDNLRSLAVVFAALDSANDGTTTIVSTLA